jgi:predicted nucleic acid-binding protein
LKDFLAKVPYENASDIRISQIPYIRDPNDIPVLSAAISSKIDVLITGDKDFCNVVLDSFKIMTPSKFAKKYM